MNTKQRESIGIESKIKLLKTMRSPNNISNVNCKWMRLFFSSNEMKIITRREKRVNRLTIWKRVMYLKLINMVHFALFFSNLKASFSYFFGDFLFAVWINEMKYQYKINWKLNILHNHEWVLIYSIDFLKYNQIDSILLWWHEPSRWWFMELQMFFSVHLSK